MKSNRISYQYVNKSDQPVELWLSAAPGTRNIAFAKAQPDRTEPHPFLGELYHFTLSGKEQLSYEALYEAPTPPALSEAERAYFLRDSELIPVNADMKQKAQALTAGLSADKDKAEAVFNYVKDEFGYTGRLQARGTEECLRKKAGDCGELSAVIASYCRSLGIPCRIMVGAFRGRFQPHAWNEVHVDGKWMPMDVSLAMYSFFRYPLRNIGATVKWGAFSDKTRYFGQVESGRAVFSIDPERRLDPPYPEIESAEKAPESAVFPVGSGKLAWGFESLAGAAPYMQPIYPRLNDTYEKVRTKDLLGTFRVNSNNALDRYSYQLKIASFSLAIVFIYLEILTGLFNLALAPALDTFMQSATAILLGVFGVLTLARREFNAPVLVLCILFVFSTVSTVYRMIGVS